MTPILNHLWQSSLFAIAAGLLTLLLRRNSARTRYWLWFAASVKFLIPFSLLVDAGSRVEWRTAPAIAQPAISIPLEQVFTAPALVLPQIPRHESNYWPLIVSAVWLCGFLMVLFSWWRQWRRIRIAVEAAKPFLLELPIKTMSSPTLLEPGVFGIFRPVLLLPEGIAERLKPEQLEAIVAHELCHVRSYDNLAAAVHMLSEAIFWFHPLLWWIGKRLVDERERACDEEVLRLGSQPQVYAESILKVCKLYLESPLDCVSGITGSDLRKRIRNIMTHAVSLKLNVGKKLLLAAAGVVAVMTPIVVGILNAPRIHAQSSETLAFEVASVKPSKAGTRGGSLDTQPGRLTITNITLRTCIKAAYELQDYQLTGGPSWPEAERYDIVAKAESPVGDHQVMLMFQRLLAERFKLAIHRETKELPGYVLVVGKNGLKLREGEPAGKGWVRNGPGSINGEEVSMARLAESLSQRLRQPVVDQTGIKGVFYLKLEWTPDQSLSKNPEETKESPAAESGASIFTALREQVGLKLEARKVPAEIVVVDHVERPSGNDQAFFRKAMWTPQTFEVASVKQVGPSGDGGMKSADGKGQGPSFGLEHRRLNSRLNLYALIVNAYGLRGCKPMGELGGCTLLSGGPDWLRKDQFEVVAKIPDDAPDYTSVQFVNQHAPQLQLMLQALLADRFHLKVHRETKELPIYALTIAKKGPQLKKAPEAEESKVFFRGSVQGGQEMVRLTSQNGSMQDLVDLYAKFTDRPMVDRTGLQDRYDFTVEYEADTEATGPFARLTGPALFKALESQAGLKLEATKGPVEILVIDHAEKPSAN